MTHSNAAATSILNLAREIVHAGNEPFTSS